MQHEKRSGFTLVELLVVIAIISVLAALLLPALEGALFQARLSGCASQQKQIYLACQMYVDDNAGLYPFAGQGNAGLWTVPSLTSQYFGAVRQHEYTGLGLLWRLGYMEDRTILLDLDWSNPSREAETFTRYCIYANDTLNWNWLEPPVGNYPAQRASTWSSSCYARFFHDYKNPGPIKVPRRLDKTHSRTTALYMCAMAGNYYPNVGAHQKEFVNATYEDGHVRSLHCAPYIASLGMDNSYGKGTYGNECVVVWWAWAKNEDSK